MTTYDLRGAKYENDEEAARVVPLAPELGAPLASWRLVTRGGNNDRVVLVGGVRPLIEGASDMAAKTRSACKRAGLAPVTFHDLRASYATLVAAAGLPIGKLQALLGHASPSTTSIYVRSESEHAALDPRAVLGGHVLATPISGRDEVPN
jgi:integrase